MSKTIEVSGTGLYTPVKLDLQGEEITFDFLDFSTADQVKISKDIKSIYNKAQKYDEVNERYEKKIKTLEEQIAKYEDEIFTITDVYEERAIEDENVDDIDKYIADALEKDDEYQKTKTILDRYKARLAKTKKDHERDLKKTGFDADDIEKYHKKLLEARIKDEDALNKLFTFGEKYGFKPLYTTINDLVTEGKERGKAD